MGTKIPCTNINVVTKKNTWRVKTEEMWTKQRIEGMDEKVIKLEKFDVFR